MLSTVAPDNIGVFSKGDVFKTTDPVPVEVVTPVPPFKTATMPVTLAAVPVTLPTIGEEKVLMPAMV